MKIVNLGCGSVRPKSEAWINVDTLHGQMPDDQHEAILREPNYIERDITERLPFENDTIDGVLMAHVLEHFSVQHGQSLLREALRILNPGGRILVSVPDAEYFRHVHAKDKGANSWPELFGVTDPPNPIPTWMQAALFFEQHWQVFSEDTLWCALTNAGFSNVTRASKPPIFEDAVLTEMGQYLDRIPFSLVMHATKP